MDAEMLAQMSLDQLRQQKKRFQQRNQELKNLINFVLDHNKILMEDKNTLQSLAQRLTLIANQSQELKSESKFASIVPDKQKIGQALSAGFASIRTGISSLSQKIGSNKQQDEGQNQNNLKNQNNVADSQETVEVSYSTKEQQQQQQSYTQEIADILYEPEKKLPELFNSFKAQLGFKKQTQPIAVIPVPETSKIENKLQALQLEDNQEAEDEQKQIQIQNDSSLSKATQNMQKKFEELHTDSQTKLNETLKLDLDNNNEEQQAEQSITETKVIYYDPTKDARLNQSVEQNQQQQPGALLQAQQKIESPQEMARRIRRQILSEYMAQAENNKDQNFDNTHIYPQACLVSIQQQENNGQESYDPDSI